MKEPRACNRQRRTATLIVSKSVPKVWYWDSWLKFLFWQMLVTEPTNAKGHNKWVQCPTYPEHMELPGCGHRLLINKFKPPTLEHAMFPWRLPKRGIRAIDLDNHGLKLSTRPNITAMRTHPTDVTQKTLGSKTIASLLGRWEASPCLAYTWWVGSWSVASRSRAAAVTSPIHLCISLSPLCLCLWFVKS